MALIKPYITYEYYLGKFPLGKRTLDQTNVESIIEWVSRRINVLSGNIIEDKIIDGTINMDDKTSSLTDNIKYQVAFYSNWAITNGIDFSMANVNASFAGQSASYTPNILDSWILIEQQVREEIQNLDLVDTLTYGSIAIGGAEDYPSPNDPTPTWSPNITEQNLYSRLLNGWLELGNHLSIVPIAPNSPSRGVKLSINPLAFPKVEFKTKQKLIDVSMVGNGSSLLTKDSIDTKNAEQDLATDELHSALETNIEATFGTAVEAPAFKAGVGKGIEITIVPKDLTVLAKLTYIDYWMEYVALNVTHKGWWPPYFKTIKGKPTNPTLFWGVKYPFLDSNGDVQWVYSTAWFTDTDLVVHWEPVTSTKDLDPKDFIVNKLRASGNILIDFTTYLKASLENVSANLTAVNANKIGARMTQVGDRSKSWLDFGDVYFDINVKAGGLGWFKHDGDNIATFGVDGFDMLSHKIANVKAGTTAKDAINKGQLDTVKTQVEANKGAIATNTTNIGLRSNLNLTNSDLGAGNAGKILRVHSTGSIEYITIPGALTRKDITSTYKTRAWNVADGGKKVWITKSAGIFYFEIESIIAGNCTTTKATIIFTLGTKTETELFYDSLSSLQFLVRKDTVAGTSPVNYSLDNQAITKFEIEE